jgi:hypothetical protein
MANTTIQLKHSTVASNVPSALANGEISINSRDGKFFYSTPAGVVTAFNSYPGPSGLDTEIQFNDAGVIGGSEKLTFNKTTGQLTVNGTVRANIFSADGINIYTFAGLGFNQANAAFLAANAATATDTTQNNSITAAFIRANNSVDANNGGTITGNVTITTNLSVSNLTITNTLIATTANLTVNTITTGSGVGGTIAGANVIYSNVFVANSGGYVQFSDGSKQYTANAGSGGSDTSAGTYANAAFATANTITSASSYANSGFAVANSASVYANAAFAKANTGTTGANSFGIIYTSNNTTYANATTANARVNFVGENGSVVYANAITNTITFAGTPGLQGLTVDYGFVNDPIYYSLDYGTL